MVHGPSGLEPADRAEDFLDDHRRSRAHPNGLVEQAMILGRAISGPAEVASICCSPPEQRCRRGWARPLGEAAGTARRPGRAPLEVPLAAEKAEHSWGSQRKRAV